MSISSSLGKALSCVRPVLGLVTEVSKAAIMHNTRKNRSKKRFREVLSRQDLPPQVVAELSRRYDESLPSIREIVRDRGRR